MSFYEEMGKGRNTKYPPKIIKKKQKQKQSNKELQGMRKQSQKLQ